MCIIAVLALVGQLQSSSIRSSNLVEGISTIVGLAGLLLYNNRATFAGVVAIGLSMGGSLFDIIFLRGRAYEKFYFWVFVAALVYLAYLEARQTSAFSAFDRHRATGESRESTHRVVEENVTRQPDKARNSYRQEYQIARKSYFEQDLAKCFDLYRKLLSEFRVPRRHQKWFIGRLVTNGQLWEAKAYDLVAARARELIPLTTDGAIRASLNWWLWYALYYSERYQEMLAVTEEVLLGRLSNAQQEVVGRARCYALNRLGRHQEAIAEIDQVLPALSDRDRVVELLKCKCDSLVKLERYSDVLQECRRLRTLGVDDEVVRSFEEYSSGNKGRP